MALGKLSISMSLRDLPRRDDVPFTSFVVKTPKIGRSPRSTQNGVLPPHDTLHDIRIQSVIMQLSSFLAMVWIYLESSTSSAFSGHVDRRCRSSSTIPTNKLPCSSSSTRTTCLYGLMGRDYFENFPSPGDNNSEGNSNNNKDDNQDNNNNQDDNNDNGDGDDGTVDYERYKAALEHNTRRTDVRLFLTQRSIQSF